MAVDTPSSAPKRVHYLLQKGQEGVGTEKQETYSAQNSKRYEISIGMSKKGHQDMLRLLIADPRPWKEATELFCLFVILLLVNQSFPLETGDTRTIYQAREYQHNKSHDT